MRFSMRLRFNLLRRCLLLVAGLALLLNFYFISIHDRFAAKYNTNCIAISSWSLRVLHLASMLQSKNCSRSFNYGNLPSDILIYQITNKTFTNSSKSCDPLLRFNLPEIGGRFVPPDCTPLDRVLIVVPIRDRPRHLEIFLHYMHPFLQRKNIEYRIVVIEQLAGSAFNRGMLMNIGFLEGGKLFKNFDCCIFHDVDLLPEHDGIDYRCAAGPTLMSSAVDYFRYKYGTMLPYSSIFGGVENFRRDHFYKINGFSNQYFGWGGEDDDLYSRVILNYLPFQHLPTSIARYKMLTHQKAPRNPKRLDLLKTTSNRINLDGLNNIVYNVESTKLFPFYTLFKVNISEANMNLTAIY